jgi:hypothetical protein
MSSEGSTLNSASLSPEQYQKIVMLKEYYDNHHRSLKYQKFVALGLIGFAWILSLFLGFTLPFFIFHLAGTSMWMYQYLSNHPQLKTLSDYLVNPVFWFLMVLNGVCSIYIVISGRRCGAV